MILDRRYSFARLASVCQTFRSIPRYAWKRTSQGWSNFIDYRFKGSTKVAATVNYVETQTATGAKVYKAVMKTWRFTVG